MTEPTRESPQEKAPEVMSAPSKQFLKRIDKEIEDSNTDVIDSVIKSRVETERCLRVELIEKGLDVIKAQKEECHKIKAKSVSVDPDTEKETEIWDPADLKKKRENIKKLKELEDAFGEAINKGKYDRLKKLINQKPANS